MPRSFPVTQRDVAQACGLHQSTVCLALRNAPSIPSATRLKVSAIAEQLGYRPNAAASRLSLLRVKKSDGRGVPIAWVNQEPASMHWHADPEARAYFEGARRRAGERGYRLEEVWTREPGMTTNRLARILRARGIEGVIFPVHRRFDPALFTSVWSDFALIGLNDHRLAGWFDVVCTDHFRDLDTACRHLRELNLARAGLVLSAEVEAASNGLLHACVLRAQAAGQVEASVPVCLLPETRERRLAAFLEWFSRYQPEAVITTEAALAAAARREGCVATWLGLGSAAAPFDGGVEADRSQLGALAVDGMVDKMRRFETGWNRSSRLELLPGTWTVPRAAPVESVLVWPGAFPQAAVGG